MYGEAVDLGASFLTPITFSLIFGGSFKHQKTTCLGTRKKKIKYNCGLDGALSHHHCHKCGQTNDKLLYY